MRYRVHENVTDGKIVLEGKENSTVVTIAFLMLSVLILCLSFIYLQELCDENLVPVTECSTNSSMSGENKVSDYIFLNTT